MRQVVRAFLAVLLLAWFFTALLIPMLPFYERIYRMTQAQLKSRNQDRKQQHTQRPQHRG